MSRIGFVKLLAVLVLTLGSNELWATIVYQVGTCKPGSFPTISAALAATPSPNVVKICPGTYPEQVHITYAVTLQGMISGNSGDVIIASPPNGLVVNAADDLGDSICADIFVDVLPAPFTISDITLDAANNAVLAPNYVAGIFVKNSSGTVNHVATRNQMGGAGGVGIWLEGGTSNPTVTVENSSISAFDDIGIWTQTNAATSELTANIKSNSVDGGFSGVSPGPSGIAMGPGTTNTVTGNFLVDAERGVWAEWREGGTIAGNILVGNATGILLDADGVSVSGNKILDSCPGAASGSCVGIQLNSAVALVQSNTILNSPIGIEFGCVPNPNVHGNTIQDVAIGLNHVPSGVGSSDTFYDVFTERTGGCPAVAAR